jgi:heat shock protein HslJ
MDQEADYLAFLGETSAWEIEGGTLELHSGDAAALVFRAAGGR